MSVASYEGPASRKEVGDARFRDTVDLNLSTGVLPPVEVVCKSAEDVARQLEAAQHLGLRLVAHEVNVA